MITLCSHSSICIIRIERALTLFCSRRPQSQSSERGNAMTVRNVDVQSEVKINYLKTKKCVRAAVNLL